MQRYKKQKARHARKNSRKHSLLISTSSIRSNARLPLDTSSGSRGAAELAPHGYLKKYIPALRSNILAQWPLTRSVSHSIFNGAGFRRWRRITLAMVNHSRSNLLKTALYERELLLAANEEKERSLFERRGKQRCTVNAHSELLRSRICRVKTTTAKTKRPERKALFESRISVPALWFFRVTKEHKRNSNN